MKHLGDIANELEEVGYYLQETGKDLEAADDPEVEIGAALEQMREIEARVRRLAGVEFFDAGTKDAARRLVAEAMLIRVKRGGPLQWLAVCRPREWARRWRPAYASFGSSVADARRQLVEELAREASIAAARELS